MASVLLYKRKNGAIYYYAGAFGIYLFFLTGSLVMPVGGNELLLTGPIFMHYLLDARIWRVREDPELARSLNLT